ncbi:hypothetical protein [Vibrio profundi]|uniref:hypothetical protein n=1 Tax=Vibrio profundi TaxID=1774960 RepID=UPI0037363091
MLKIEINLLNENLSWVAEIRQLNSDILYRHILPRLQHTSYLIDFRFCERNSTGIILSETGNELGHFTIL